MTTALFERTLNANEVRQMIKWFVLCLVTLIVIVVSAAATHLLNAIDDVLFGPLTKD